MVRRILRSIFAVGADRWDGMPAPDMAAHRRIALQIARQGIVLLKNTGLLPLSSTTRRIAVIGGCAQIGVPAGCGSSTVVPPGGYATVLPIGSPGGLRNLYLLPSSPVAELKKQFPNAQIEFDPGVSSAEAAGAARRAGLFRPRSSGWGSG
jgi:beta-glucosidase